MSNETHNKLSCTVMDRTHNTASVMLRSLWKPWYWSVQVGACLL